jgi:hypothetical protein
MDHLTFKSISNYSNQKNTLDVFKEFLILIHLNLYQSHMKRNEFLIFSKAKLGS